MPRPPLWRDKSRDGANLSDAIEDPGPVDPALAVPLRAHSIANLGELRRTPGSTDGNGGPRVCMLAGQATALDAGAGTFVWDPTSTLVDNALQAASAFTVAAVQGVAQGRWRRLLGAVTQSQLPDVVIGVQTFAAGGAYTASPGTKSQIVEIWGAGGGGSGAVAGTTGVNCAYGVGGGAGAYARRRYAIPAGGTGTVVIGAAGAAGANTGAIAGAGGASTFTDGTTLLTAPGGVAGPASAAAAATPLFTVGAAPTAVATNGNINGRGDEGGMGIRLAAAIAASGRGGATSLGGAGQEIVDATAAGNAAAANSGSGGGGGMSITTATPVTGGAGGTGFCVITEYA